MEHSVSSFQRQLPVMTEQGMLVARGPVATIEIGAETKILAKAMIKQIDRVISDLVNQAMQFKRGGGNPICVAFVGINFAEGYVSFEGTKRNGQPTARNTNTRFRKRPRPNSDSRTKRNPLSMNFRFCASAPPTQSHSRSSG